MIYEKEVVATLTSDIFECSRTRNDKLPTSDYIFSSYSKKKISLQELVSFRSGSFLTTYYRPESERPKVPFWRNLTRNYDTLAEPHSLPLPLLNLPAPKPQGPRYPATVPGYVLSLSSDP